MLLRNNRLLIVSMMFSLSLMPVSADVLSEVDMPKPPAYRVGISELPERQYVQAEHKKVKPTKVSIEDAGDKNFSDLTYADLSIKRISQEVAQELEYEEKEMLADLSLLWQGAAVQSDTINFALYKLANPDADKPDEKSVKNVLKTIASMSTFVGASMGSPIIAGTSLIGGNIFGIMSQDTKALNYKYTRVTDADMIILIRKVEDLQQRAVDLYYDYMTAKRQLDFANELVSDRQYKFELAQKNNAARELVVITDAYYRTALDKQRSAKSEFYSKRAALEQFVGHDTFAQFEAELAARERGETTYKTEEVSNSEETTTSEVATDDIIDVPVVNVSESPKNDAATNEEYKKTVEQVENYNNSLGKEQSKLDQRNLSDDKIMKDSRTYDFSEMDYGPTGLAAQVDGEDKKGGLFGRFKKDKSEDDVDKPQKKDPYSTKGLIFIHNDKPNTQPEFQNYPVNNYDNSSDNGKKKRFGRKQAPVQEEKKSNEFQFMPLDEIKVPELYRGGYSIHNEY